MATPMLFATAFEIFVALVCMMFIIVTSRGASWHFGRCALAVHVFSIAVVGLVGPIGNIHPNWENTVEAVVLSFIVLGTAALGVLAFAWRGERFSLHVLWVSVPLSLWTFLVSSALIMK